ncbi:SHOCT domain-containing protein [Arthrobacter sp. GCM10027362]|uniref:SHOCT domain-containing protein n=1 Tax=Arthrobacter sp. GCM10027362 TaxID=3273379 RepID=UPI00362CA9A8
MMLTAIMPAAGPVQALAGVPADPYWYGAGHGPGWWILLFPLFWILVIVLLIVLGRRLWWRGAGYEGARGAEGVLRERYARGDIDETEFRQRLEVLTERRRR